MLWEPARSVAGDASRAAGGSGHGGRAAGYGARGYPLGVSQIHGVDFTARNYNFTARNYKRYYRCRSSAFWSSHRRSRTLWLPRLAKAARLDSQPGRPLALCTTISVVACRLAPLVLTHHDVENGPVAAWLNALGRGSSGALEGAPLARRGPQIGPSRVRAAGEFLGVSFRKCLSYSRLPLCLKLRPARLGHVLSAYLGPRSSIWGI